MLETHADITFHNKIFKPNQVYKLQKASEAKVTFLVFQQVPKGKSPVEIVACRSQSNNDLSVFTLDVIKREEIVIAKRVNTPLRVFSVNGISVDFIDVINGTCKFIYGVAKHGLVLTISTT